MAMKLFGAINKEYKIVAKCVNFGIIYGITASGIVAKLETEQDVKNKPTRKEAAEWIKGWYNQFPVAAAYIERCRNAPVKGQNLISAFGRKRRFGVVSRESIHHLQNEAANFPHQSAAHDITLLSGIQTQDIMREQFDGYYVNEIHDSLLNELPDDLGMIIPAAKLLINTMQRIPVEWGLTGVPFLAEAQVGKAWEHGIKFDPFKFDETLYRGKTYEALEAA
jgi:DNA polymerase-1